MQSRVNRGRLFLWIARARFARPRVLRATAHRALPFFQFLHAYSASIRGTRFPLSSATGEPFQTFSCLVLFFPVFHQSFSRCFFSSYFLSLSLILSPPKSHSPSHLLTILFDFFFFLLCPILSRCSKICCFIEANRRFY